MMGKRFNIDKNAREDAPDVDAFLNEVLAVCRKHNMSLGHEDGQGGFIVVRGFAERDAEWLMAAMFETNQSPHHR